MRFSLVFVSVIPLFVLGGPASAASQSEMVDCQQMRDLDRGIAGCTKVAEDPSATAHDRAIAFFNRGIALYAKNDDDHAIADWTQAIKLVPNYSHAYNNRAKAYVAKTDYDHAIADYSEAIKLDPNHMLSYKGRGIAYYLSGAPDKAQADFQKAADLDPADAYVALWLDIAKRRNKQPSDLTQVTTRLNMSSWPAPVLLLFAGRLTPHDVLVAAQHIDPTVSATRLCEAYFYGGELMLSRGDKDEGAHAFKLALKNCLPSVDEFVAATAELKALGQTP
jgi:lipoprotein NlpI